MDGYHVSQPFTTEPTTGRNLNILDVPSATPAAAAPVASSKRSGHSSRASMEIPKGRALSPSNIKHPKPQKPYASRSIREADYTMSPVDELSNQFSTATIDDFKQLSNSPASSTGSSLSSRSTGGSTLSSLSSLSDASSQCTCERYGITRKGDRVKLDCGGSRCGYSDSSSGCSSDESDDESDAEPEYREIRPARRQSYATRR
jgi:hypothetical protein